ncbi:phosphohistidine phosphatase SixA [Bisgaardia hudsonensis]|uniref:Phosphohistidine phosphatase SixA n=1 Tax=Bisgaardia hudsonensis TaxID=109472 RepID=A0A4R2N3G2_9PAST|nr:phosphohistidine phosphatase SixA [Bisgaardia hudsonensis]QLB12838.1 phosphohistidine phosphatase SixA [Bisgaardia hudsonensis]TCP14397.1 phosphohistidine phosphatase SixA [Bisgaardia hudsonensis]
MQIFIMRHGEAEMMAESDMARHLTSNGRKQVRQQAEWLKSVGVNIDKVIVSPYVRAQETFDEVNAVFVDTLRGKKELCKSITPYGDVAIVIEYLSVLNDEGVENVFLISHLPLVGEIVARLVNQTNTVNFYPSTIVQIEWNKSDKRGQLKHICIP